ncbi:MAG: hypothetical protein ACO1OX_07625 [Novosphingobium sp.]
MTMSYAVIAAICSFVLGWQVHSAVNKAISLAAQRMMFRALASAVGKKRLLEELHKISEQEDAA